MMYVARGMYVSMHSAYTVPGRGYVCFKRVGPQAYQGGVGMCEQKRNAATLVTIIIRGRYCGLLYTSYIPLYVLLPPQ